MKKLLIASTALSLAGGAAFAEMAITVSGDAEMGVDYASEPGEGMSKHSFVHEVGIDFSGSGTTDGGLTFGGSAGFDTGDDVVNTGTVHVSGSFGTLTIGDNDAADLTAGGIADIGMNGIGVDDMVEGLRGNSAAALRYDNSFGQISIAISAGTKDGSAAVAAVPATQWDVRANDKTIVSFHGDAPSDAVYALRMGYTLVDNSKIANTASTLTSTIGNSPFGDSLIGTSYSMVKDGDSTTWYTVVPGADGAVSRTALTEDANAPQIDALEAIAAAYELEEKTGKEGDTVVTYYTISEEAVLDDTKRAAQSDNAMAEVSAVKSKTQYAFGMSFNAGGVTIGVGYDSDKTVSMGAGFTTGEITTNLLYVKTDDDEDTKNMDESKTGIGVDMAYSMGASTVTLAYGRMKPKEDGMEAMDAVGMGVTHDLGGGATMNAGFGKVDKMVGTEMVSENKASIGLMFAF